MQGCAVEFPPSQKDVVSERRTKPLLWADTHGSTFILPEKKQGMFVGEETEVRGGSSEAN